MGKFIKTETKMVATRGWEKGKFVFNGHRVYVEDDEKV